MKFSHVVKNNNFNDLYRQLQADLLSQGHLIGPRKMLTRELLNVNLVLTNPRDRLLYSRVRKHSYTYGAAEFLWYMNATNKLAFIEFYLPRMKDYSDDGETLNSAYGYRIFGNHKDFPHQWRNVEYSLIADSETRQAVITIHYQSDLDKPTKDLPCTMNLHFIIRDNELNLFVQMRSNDAYMGLIYDVFSFTLLQEHMLNRLKREDKFKDLRLGTYIHRSDSMHLYERNAIDVRNLSEEKSVVDLIVDQNDLIFNSDQLHALMLDETRLRYSKKPIDITKYSGINRFMAEKLNKVLTKE